MLSVVHCHLILLSGCWFSPIRDRIFVPHVAGLPSFPSPPQPSETLLRLICARWSPLRGSSCQWLICGWWPLLPPGGLHAAALVISPGTLWVGTTPD